MIHPRSPSVIYVGTAQGGVWKTTNGGIDWTPTSDNELSLAIGALAMDPSNPEGFAQERRRKYWWRQYVWTRCLKNNEWRPNMGIKSKGYI